MWNLFAATFAAHKASAQQRMLLLVSTSDVDQHGPRLCKAVQDLGVDFVCIPEHSRWADSDDARAAARPSTQPLLSCNSQCCGDRGLAQPTRQLQIAHAVKMRLQAVHVQQCTVAGWYSLPVSLRDCITIPC